jgi:hypothetical protein
MNPLYLLFSLHCLNTQPRCYHLSASWSCHPGTPISGMAPHLPSIGTSSTPNALSPIVVWAQALTCVLFLSLVATGWVSDSSCVTASFDIGLQALSYA